MTHITNYCCLTSLKLESREVQPPELMYWRFFFLIFIFYHSTPGGPRLYHPLFPRLLKYSIKTLIILIPELFYLQDRKGKAALPRNGMLFSEELRLPMKERIHINWNKIPCSCCSQQFSLRRKVFFFFLPTYAGCIILTLLSWAVKEASAFNYLISTYSIPFTKKHIINCF